MATTVEVIFSALFALTCAHYFFGVSTFLWRRAMYPIKGHSIPLVLIGVTTSSLSAATITAGYVGLPVQCDTALYTLFISGFVCAFAYMARAWRIYVHYQIQTDTVLGGNTIMRRTAKSQCESSGTASSSLTDIDASLTGRTTSKSNDRSESNTKSVPEARHHQRNFLLGTDRRLLGALAIGTALFAVAEIVPFYIHGRGGTFSPDNPCRDELGIARWVFVGLLGLAVPLIFIMLMKLRTIEDGYTIKEDLGRCICWAAVFVGIPYILPFDLYRHPVAQAAIVVGCNMVVYHTVTHKVIASFLLERRSKYGRRRRAARKNRTRRMSTTTSVTKSRSYTLADVLNNEEARDKFRDHLRREWSVENLMFHLAVKQYQTFMNEDTSREERRHLAFAIFNNFIEDDSPSMVNLPSTVRNSICEAVSVIKENDDSDVPLTIFDEAAQEIFGLMKNDTFARFKTNHAHGDIFVASESADEQTLLAAEM